jgi:hypothetical protein
MKHIHKTRLNALLKEGKRIDAAYDKLHADRLALAIESCPFTPGDEVVVGVERRRCRVAWVDAPSGHCSQRLWRMTVKPYGSKGELLKTGWQVFDDEIVERWVG